MATFRIPSLSLSDETIPAATIRYYTRRFQHRLHEIVIREIARLVDTGDTTQRKLARRLGKDPAQITRWLGAPGNWTLDTVAQLMVGAAIDPRMVLRPLRDETDLESASTETSTTTVPPQFDVAANSSPTTFDGTLLVLTHNPEPSQLHA